MKVAHTFVHKSILESHWINLLNSMVACATHQIDELPRGNAPRSKRDGYNVSHVVFILSLAGGVLITIGAIFGSLAVFFTSAYGHGFLSGHMAGYSWPFGGWTGNYNYGVMGPGMMRNFFGDYNANNWYAYTSVMLGLGVAGLASGTVVILAALLIRAKRQNRPTLLAAVILVLFTIGPVAVSGVHPIGGALGTIGAMLTLLLID